MTGVQDLSIWSISDVLYAFVEDQVLSNKPSDFVFKIKRPEVIRNGLGIWECDEYNLGQDLLMEGLQKVYDSGVKELEDVQRIVFDMICEAEMQWMRNDWFLPIAGDDFAVNQRD